MAAELLITQIMSLLSPQWEPTIDLLEAFVEHWKGITHYYIESTGERSWEERMGRGTRQLRGAGAPGKGQLLPRSSEF